MGRSLLVLAVTFCFSLHSARAGPHGAIEPYQVLDIRMEEGGQNVANTYQSVGDAKSNINSAIFLAGEDGRNLNRIASIVAEQKAESAKLSSMLKHLGNN